MQSVGQRIVEVYTTTAQGPRPVTVEALHHLASKPRWYLGPIAFVVFLLAAIAATVAWPWASRHPASIHLPDAPAFVSVRSCAVTVTDHCAGAPLLPLRIVAEARGTVPLPQSIHTAIGAAPLSAPSWVVDGSSQPGECRVALCVARRRAPLVVETSNAVVSLRSVSSGGFPLVVLSPPDAGATASTVDLGSAAFHAAVHVNLSHGVVRVGDFSNTAATHLGTGIGPLVVERSPAAAAVSVSGTALAGASCVAHGVAFEQATASTPLPGHKHCTAPTTHSLGVSPFLATPLLYSLPMVCPFTASVGVKPSAHPTHLTVRCSSVYIKHRSRKAESHFASEWRDAALSAYPHRWLGTDFALRPGPLVLNASAATPSPFALSLLQDTPEWAAASTGPFAVQGLDVVLPDPYAAAPLVQHASRRVLFEISPGLLSTLTLFALSPKTRRFRAPLLHYGCPASPASLPAPLAITALQSVHNAAGGAGATAVALDKGLLRQYYEVVGAAQGEASLVPLDRSHSVWVMFAVSVIAVIVVLYRGLKQGIAGWPDLYDFLRMRRAREARSRALGMTLETPQHLFFGMTTFAALVAYRVLALFSMKRFSARRFLATFYRPAPRSSEWVTVEFGDTAESQHEDGSGSPSTAQDFRSEQASETSALLGHVQGSGARGPEQRSVSDHEQVQVQEEHVLLPPGFSEVPFGITVSTLLRQQAQWASLNLTPPSRTVDAVRRAVERMGGRVAQHEKVVVVGLRRRHALSGHSENHSHSTDLDVLLECTFDPLDSVLLDYVVAKLNNTEKLAHEARKLGESGKPAESRESGDDEHVDRKFTPSSRAQVLKKLAALDLVVELRPLAVATGLVPRPDTFDIFRTLALRDIIEQHELGLTWWPTDVPLVLVATHGFLGIVSALWTLLWEGMATAFFAIAPMAAVSVLIVFFRHEVDRFQPYVLSARAPSEACPWEASYPFLPAPFVWAVALYMLCLILEPMAISASWMKQTPHPVVTMHGFVFFSLRILVTAVAFTMWIGAGIVLTAYGLTVALWWTLGSLIAPNVMLIFTSSTVAVLAGISSLVASARSAHGDTLRAVKAAILREMERVACSPAVFSGAGNAPPGSAERQVTRQLQSSLDVLLLQSTDRAYDVQATTAALEFPPALEAVLGILTDPIPATTETIVKSVPKLFSSPTFHIADNHLKYLKDCLSFAAGHNVNTFGTLEWEPRDGSLSLVEMRANYVAGTLALSKDMGLKDGSVSNGRVRPGVMKLLTASVLLQQSLRSMARDNEAQDVQNAKYTLRLLKDLLQTDNVDGRDDFNTRDPWITALLDRCLTVFKRALPVGSLEEHLKDCVGKNENETPKDGFIPMTEEVKLFFLVEALLKILNRRDRFVFITDRLTSTRPPQSEGVTDSHTGPKIPANSAAAKSTATLYDRLDINGNGAVPPALTADLKKAITSAQNVSTPVDLATHGRAVVRAMKKLPGLGRGFFMTHRTAISEDDLAEEALVDVYVFRRADCTNLLPLARAFELPLRLVEAIVSPCEYLVSIGLTVVADRLRPLTWAPGFVTPPRTAPGQPGAVCLCDDCSLVDVVSDVPVARQGVTRAFLHMFHRTFNAQDIEALRCEFMPAGWHQSDGHLRSPVHPPTRMVELIFAVYPLPLAHPRRRLNLLEEVKQKKTTRPGTPKVDEQRPLHDFKAHFHLGDEAYAKSKLFGRFPRPYWANEFVVKNAMFFSALAIVATALVIWSVFAGGGARVEIAGAVVSVTAHVPGFFTVRPVHLVYRRFYNAPQICGFQIPGACAPVVLVLLTAIASVACAAAGHSWVLPFAVSHFVWVPLFTAALVRLHYKSPPSFTYSGDWLWVLCRCVAPHWDGQGLGTAVCSKHVHADPPAECSAEDEEDEQSTKSTTLNDILDGTGHASLRTTSSLTQSPLTMLPDSLLNSTGWEELEQLNDGGAHDVGKLLVTGFLPKQESDGQGTTSETAAGPTELSPTPARGSVNRDEGGSGEPQCAAPSCPRAKPLLLLEERYQRAVVALSFLTSTSVTTLTEESVTDALHIAQSLSALAGTSLYTNTAARSALASTLNRVLSHYDGTSTLGDRCVAAAVFVRNLDSASKLRPLISAGIDDSSHAARLQRLAEWVHFTQGRVARLSLPAVRRGLHSVGIVVGEHDAQTLVSGLSTTEDLPKASLPVAVATAHGQLASEIASRLQCGPEHLTGSVLLSGTILVAAVVFLLLGSTAFGDGGSFSSAIGGGLPLITALASVGRTRYVNQQLSERASEMAKEEFTDMASLAADE